MFLSIFEDKPNLDEIGFKNEKLESFSKQHIDILPNFVFNGISGSGKSTKIYAFLCSLFNDKIYNLKINEYEYDKKKIVYKSSIYHIEVDILELLSNEKIFFSNFLKEYCLTRNIGLDLPKVIYLKNANKMSKNSMLFCRKLIESNYMSCRFIFETNGLHNIPISLLSRFLIIRVPMPSIKEIETVLKAYLKKKKIKIDKKNFDIILKKSGTTETINLKKVMGFIRYYSITNKHYEVFYDRHINQLLEIIKTKNLIFSNINIVKNIIQEIYINLINLEEVLIIIFKDISKRYTNINFIIEFVELTSASDINMNRGNKNFIQFENYVIKTILLIKKYYS